MYGILVILGLAASAAERPTKAYVAAMKSLETVSHGLDQAINSHDHQTMNQHIILARSALAVVQRYWRDSAIDDDDDAIKTISGASRAISEISVAAYLMGLSPNPVAVEGAELALKNLRTSCTTCHTAHRLELPDGSYLIK